MFALIVYVLISRFQLTVAAGGRAALLQGPVALAPEPGREQRVGEASAAAGAFGVRSGMAVGEALARCPALRLVPPDPAAVADAWERLLARLEGIGAALEPAGAGGVCFAANGLEALHGGSLAGVVGATRRALRVPARIGAGPSRFSALAAATRARPRAAELVPDRPGGAVAYLAALPVSLLGARPETAALCEPLERLGVRTLGELRALGRPALAARFGQAGLTAHDLAGGLDSPLRPRALGERIEERIGLPEAVLGPQLERALGLLVARLLARPERRSRTLRAAVLTARLVEGGAWRQRVVFREALADPLRMREALAPHLRLLSAPAEELRLAADGLGPPAWDQRGLAHGGAGANREGAFGVEADAERRARLREAVRQARVAGGPDAALRVLEIDPSSRVPERRVMLAPFET